MQHDFRKSFLVVIDSSNKQDRSNKQTSSLNKLVLLNQLKW